MSDELYNNNNQDDTDINRRQEFDQYNTTGEYNNTNQESTSNLYRYTNQDIIQDVTTTSSGTNSEYRFWAEDNITVEQRRGDNLGGASDHIFDMSSNTQPTKKHKFLRKAVKFIAGAALFGIVAGASFLGFHYVYYKINPDASPINFNGAGGFNLNVNDNSTQIATTTVSNAVIQQKTDITDVVEKTMPSIVTITSTFTDTYSWFGQEFNEENEGGGSGIIVGENDKELLIATNNHVVDNASKILVNFIDNTQIEAIVKGTDVTADLAVITIDKKDISKETLSAIKIAKLGDSESVKVGQMAIAIGNALGYGQSVTVGYVSAKDREVDVADNKMVLLQTDAAINPGNSGGALLNIAGEVIGINSVKYASSEVEGMGYAIPISKAIPIINDLMKREILKEDEKGYLGIYIEDITQELTDMYGWPMGVYVKSTIEGGSAEKAGILAGDIITKVNDSEITTRVQLQEKITSFRVGTEIKLTVMRSTNGKYQEKEITVVLGKNPELDN